MHGACERSDDRDRRAESVDAVGAHRLACARMVVEVESVIENKNDMKRVQQILPALAVLAVLIAAWWASVALTGSVIFPSPWQVVTGTIELIEDGTLWMHIGASLVRVGAGFLIAVVVAIPLGLWMGWVKGAYETLNPLFQILRPTSPIAWIPSPSSGSPSATRRRST